ncbi:MAG TPA: Do family serine endopeptidase [Vicinamibacteria bacterium]|nr:Do family serine endopeptidase [Vicinamibacteria bacterium]
MKAQWKTFGGIGVAGAAGLLLGALGSGEIRGAERRTPAEASVPAAPSTAEGAVTLGTFQAIAHRDDAAVVNISTSKVVHEAKMMDPFFEFFGRNGSPLGAPWGRGGDETLTQRSLGSGFVVDARGYVLTNRHVVDGADQVQVTLANGHHYKAKVAGEDARTDIALLRIEPRETLVPLPLGDSDGTQVGEWVMAVGNPFGLGGNSVTVGVVSFKGRTLDLSTHGTPVDMLQTDAAINPGNSGGPLINARGEAVGINTLIMTGGAQQYSGVGFAVPINVARDILPQLRDRGHVVRGWLGVQVQAIDEDLAKSLKMSDTHGALVSNVASGSPAEEAGLKAGDVVRALDGKAVETSSDLSSRVAAKGPGSRVALDVQRDGSDRTIEVKLGTFPDQEAAEPRADEGHGRLGAGVRTLTPDVAQGLDMPADAHGAVIVRVEPGSPADAAGLRERDVVVSVDGQPVASAEAFRAAVEKARSGDVLRLRVRRGPGYLFVAVRPS